MANNDWVNRTTKQHVAGASPAFMSERFGGSFIDANNDPFHVDWIFNPILPAVAPRYWNISGDLVTEMSASEKAVVDQAALDSSRDAKVGQLDSVEDDLRQVVALLVRELNILRALHGLPDRTFAQVKASIRSGYGS